MGSVDIIFLNLFRHPRDLVRLSLDLILTTCPQTQFTAQEPSLNLKESVN